MYLNLYQLVVNLNRPDAVPSFSMSHCAQCYFFFLPVSYNKMEDGNAPAEDSRSSIQKKEQAALGSLNVEGDSGIDTTQAMAALQTLTSQKKVVSQEEEERRKALASVKVAPEDVELIVTEMEVSKAVADRVIREHGGDVVEALRSMVRG